MGHGIEKWQRIFLIDNSLSVSNWKIKRCTLCGGKCFHSLR